MMTKLSKPRWRPRWAAVAAAAAVGLLLAGCSGGSHPSGTPSGGGSLAGQSIDVWYPGAAGTETDYVKNTIVPGFEKATGATVNVTFIDWGSLSPKLTTAFAAGQGPDVFGHGAAAVAGFSSNGLLEPLTKDVKSLSASDRKDLAATLPDGQVDGVQYMMPINIAANLLVYNAKDFEAAGLDPDKPPTTWEQVYADAQKLTQRDASGNITRSGLLLPSNKIGRQQTFAMLIASAGGSQVDKSGTKAAFDSAAGRKALDYFTKLYDGPDAVSADLGDDFIDSPPNQQPVVTGTAAMQLIGDSSASQVFAQNPDLDLRIVQPPKFEGAKQGRALGAATGLMINAASKHKQLAWAFLKYMTSSKVSNPYIAKIGAVPIRASAADTAAVKDDKVTSAFLEAAPEFVANPNVAAWVQVRDQMDSFIEQALHKTLSVQDALSQAADATNKLLK